MCEDIEAFELNLKRDNHGADAGSGCKEPPEDEI
jgi:hypothetical protein